MNNNKTEKAVCIVCGKKYLKLKKPTTHTMHNVKIRRSNSKTCSKKCSMIHRTYYKRKGVVLVK